jgi:hypothetical protein
VCCVFHYTQIYNPKPDLPFFAEFASQVQLLTREAECAAKSSLLHLLGHEKLFYTGGDSKQHAKFIEKTLQPLVRRP